MEEEEEVYSPVLSPEASQAFHDSYHLLVNDMKEQVAGAPPELVEHLDQQATLLAMMIFLSLEMIMYHYHHVSNEQLANAFETAMSQFKSRYTEVDEDDKRYMN